MTEKTAQPAPQRAPLPTAERRLGALLAALFGAMLLAAILFALRPD